jgi:acyl carrier protein
METLEILKEAIAQYAKNPPDELRPEQELAAIGVDSLTLMELVFHIEEKFDVRFPDDMPRPTTVGELTEIADKLRAGLPIATPAVAQAAVATADTPATGSNGGA